MSPMGSVKGQVPETLRRTKHRAMLQKLMAEEKSGRKSTAKGGPVSARGRYRSGKPLSRLENTIDLTGESGDSGSVETDDSFGEADDEDDAILSMLQLSAVSKGKGTGIDALGKGPRKARSYVPNRPSNRLWLDHVAVPAPCQKPANAPKKSQSISLTFRDSPRTVKTRQTSLTTYFSGSAAGVGRPASIPNRRKAAAASSDKATRTQSSPITDEKALVSIGSEGSRVDSLATAKQEESFAEDFDSDVVVTSVSKARRRGKRPVVAACLDVDPESSYTGKQNDSIEDTDNIIEDGGDGDSDEVTEAPSQKRGKATKTKTTQTTLTGGRAGARRKEPAKSKKRNQDSWTYKSGISEDLPPLNDIGEIFDDMVKKLASSGIKKVAEHLGSRKLKVATMCSGTESPILALGLIAESMRKHFGLGLEIDHLFSAEIVPFKQAYIERNFSPPIIFRDMRELTDSDKNATTAYGAMVPIPGDVDLLVAGFSCVDFSQLNGHKVDLNDSGESGDTFRAILHYAKKWRPTIVVLENVYNAPWNLIKESWESHANYSAEWIRVDTKAYYIPHTRMRGYMICLDNEKMKSARKAVGEWKYLVEGMKRPASCPIEAFLLPEDDPRVHRGREELAKGLRGGERNPREVDWTKCQGRHQDYRADLLLGSKRPMTGWEDNGSCKMPDFCWNDWGTAQVERIWDTFEVSLLRNVRRGFDSQYKTRVWELSQNIDRFTDTTPFGLTGCVTPTGVPYVTIRGGPMVGLEALAMQGLPIERLLLTREHQKQLQDLAGNAMSTTVVGAAMLGALILGYKALEPGYGEKMVVDAVEDVTKHISGENHLTEEVLDLATFKEISVDSILRDARRSSRLCICEGRALMTPNRLQRCRQCYHTTCLKCGGNPKHDYSLFPVDVVASRLPPGEFENCLKDTLPMRVRVAGISGQALETLKGASGVRISDEDWMQLSRAIEPTLGVELRFHSLKRAETWTVFYESPTSRMELVLYSHLAEWRLFAKPSKRENVNSNVRKLLARPFARMRAVGNSLVDGKWQFCFPTEFSFKTKIQGKGNPVRSWESKLGLQEPDFADRKLWSMLHLSIEGEVISHLDMDISGDYKLLPDCGTAGGCLHKRIASQDGEEGAASLFLFLDPSRYGNPLDDYFVFSTDIRRYNYGERRPIIARLDPKWRPLHSSGAQTVKCTVDGQWVDIESAKFETVVSETATTYATPSLDMSIEFSNNSCVTANAILSCKVPLPTDEEVGWAKGEWVEVDTPSEKTVFSSFAWLTERVRYIKDFDTWRFINLPRDFDRCQKCAPNPPKVKWRVEKEKLEPFEDPQQAAPYERALKNRPAAFLTHVRIDNDGVGLLKIGLNISSLIHRGFSNLPKKGPLSDVELSWRLTTNYVPPPKVVLPKFSLRSNKKDPSCAQPPNFKTTLRPEQLRSLGWMMRQEAEDVIPFMEEEIEEALLPHLGWRAEGRATKNITIRGGVLADQVGYGKTATTLGLIDSQFPREKQKPLKEIPGKISLKATLIIVPHTLLNQWVNEIKKFLGSTYVVLSIKATQVMNNLRISDFENADIIITNWSVLNLDSYCAKLAHFAALPDKPSGAGRAFEAWYTYALQRIAEHVDTLRDNGAEVLEQTLKAKLKSFEDDDELVRYVPSKRLRGTVYRKAQQAKAQAKARDAKPGKKRKADDISLSDGEPAIKKGPSDPFSLRDRDVRKDWRKMKNPLFQMFNFNRLVVDEYTYVAGNDHTSITNLQANVRWVLSGTPPLGDFADVKTISVFLGINLGIDDDAVGVIQAHNIKAMGKDRTAVEEFQSFRQVHSPAWHQRRHEHAQDFLNQFVRQNIAEIDEIPFDEHLRCIELPAAEKAIYMELHHHLLSQEMRIRKGKSKIESDRERRLNQTIGNSKSPEEALVKRCCHFTLDDLTTNRENATQACDLIVAERKSQYEDLVSDLKKNLKHAVWLKHYCGSDDEHYDGWKRNVKANAFGDCVGTEELLRLIKAAKPNYREEDGELFYKDIDKVDAEKKKRAKESAAKKAKAAKKGAKKRRINGEEEDEDESPDDTRQPWPVTKADHVQALRNLTNHLRRLSKELISRIRSLRFFEAVRDLQLKESGLLDDEERAAGCTCSKCEKSLPAPKLSVLSLCGHVACDECMKTWGRSDECIVSGCDAAARSFHIVRATELGQEDAVARFGRHYGRKLEQMMKFIKSIPEDDQVLLFVQFDDLIEKVSTALNDYKISHYALTKKLVKTAATMMSAFQETRDGPDKKKVLVLNVADESASGANLTNANHIIFLSPLLTETQYHYDASTTQAIGRARRYGQKKPVHIHRFLALKTIDVDIIQERTAKRLVNIGEGYDLKPENKIDPNTPSLGSWMTRREEVMSDTD